MKIKDHHVDEAASEYIGHRCCETYGGGLPPDGGAVPLTKKRPSIETETETICHS